MPKLRRREMFVKSLRARLSVHEYSKWRSPRIINMTGKQKMSTPSKLLFVLLVNFRKRKRSRATNNIPPDSSRFETNNLRENSSTIFLSNWILVLRIYVRVMEVQIRARYLRDDKMTRVKDSLPRIYIHRGQAIHLLDDNLEAAQSSSYLSRY